MISIADKGYGISEDEIDRIFQRFYRVESSRQRAKGSGLGLSIVEMIVAKHFGKIRVSEVGKGSVFNIFLPASPQ